MSLINDALKRANQAPPPPPSPAEVASDLCPVEYQRSSVWPQLWFPFLVAFVILGLGGWFLVKGWEGSRALSARASTVPVTALSTPSEGAVASAVSNAQPISASPVQIIQPPLVSDNAPVLVVEAAEPPKPTFPNLKLQGIFYRPSNPSAVINGKSVYRGDKVEKVKVLNITRDSVTLQWEAETKELTLE